MCSRCSPSSPCPGSSTQSCPGQVGPGNRSKRMHDFALRRTLRFICSGAIGQHCPGGLKNTMQAACGDESVYGAASDDETAGYRARSKMGLCKGRRMSVAAKEESVSRQTWPAASPPEVGNPDRPGKRPAHRVHWPSSSSRNQRPDSTGDPLLSRDPRPRPWIRPRIRGPPW